MSVTYQTGQLARVTVQGCLDKEAAAQPRRDLSTDPA